MKTRLEIQALLEEIPGVKKVYFKAPPNKSMVYPCIIYQTNNTNTMKANNKKYLKYRNYLLTLVTDNPDTDIIDRIEDLQYCTFDRQFVNDNKYHYIFSIYF